MIYIYKHGKNFNKITQLPNGKYLIVSLGHSSYWFTQEFDSITDLITATLHELGGTFIVVKDIGQMVDFIKKENV